jgi:hypothetical protein
LRRTFACSVETHDCRHGRQKPGDYVLQVIVTDKLADEKSNTAAQWIDFSVHR